MKHNLKFDNKNFVAEVTLANVIEEDEKDVHATYMAACMESTATLMDTTDTTEMSKEDAKYMCGMKYMKSRHEILGGGGQLNENQNMLPVKTKLAILKRFEKQNILSEQGKKQLKDLEGDSWHEAKAEPTAVFPQEPAPPTGDITPHLAEEGLKIDEKDKKEQQESRIKNPDLQSAYFEVVEK